MRGRDRLERLPPTPRCAMVVRFGVVQPRSWSSSSARCCSMASSSRPSTGMKSGMSRTTAGAFRASGARRRATRARAPGACRPSGREAWTGRRLERREVCVDKGLRMFGLRVGEPSNDAARHRKSGIKIRSSPFYAKNSALTGNPAVVSSGGCGFRRSRLGHPSPGASGWLRGLPAWPALSR